MTAHPYADTWRRYMEGGWMNPLPLPFKKKKSPPSGFTGHDGHPVTKETAAMWATKPYYDNQRYARGNICLGMPDDIIGIDVDAWGGKPGAATLTELENRLGPLPLGPASTNRPGTPSMIRYFRVPEGHLWIHNLPGIEIIQRTHRYALVYPSIHPEGRPYHWIHLAKGSPNAAEYIPYVVDLPDLPDAWITELTEKKTYTKPQTAREFTPLERDEILSDGEPCQPMQRAISNYLSEVQAGTAHHDASNETQLRLVRLGEQGHSGAAAALEALRTLFLPSRRRLPAGRCERGCLRIRPRPTRGNRQSACQPNPRTGQGLLR